MARKSIREPQVDGYLLLSFAKTDRLHDLEDFLAGLNVADVQSLFLISNDRFLILERNVTMKNSMKLPRFSLQVSRIGLDWQLLWSISANSRMPSTAHVKLILQSDIPMFDD
jgi:hypothetical protein